MICTKCGATMASDAEACAGCGTPVIRVQQSPSIGWGTESTVAASEPEWDPSSYTVAPAPRVVTYAGFWLRAVAYVVDLLIVTLVSMPALIILTPFAGTAWEQYSKLTVQQMYDLQNPAVRPFMAIVLPIVLFCGWLYYALCESSSWQATPGKRLLGLRVCDMEGRRITFTRASGRFLGRILTGLVPFGVGYLMAGFTARKQALHDLIASCLVLRNR